MKTAYQHRDRYMHKINRHKEERENVSINDYEKTEYQCMED